MDELDYWRFSDELTSIQAAYLVIGEAPPDLKDAELKIHFRLNPPSKGFYAVRNSIERAVINHDLAANIKYGYHSYQVDNPTKGSDLASLFGDVKYIPDWDLTTIRIGNLKRWLASKGMDSGFFFPKADNETAQYMDEAHPHYSRKLAAAIDCWQAVSIDESSRRGVSVKQALLRWLRINAVKYELIKPDGALNEQAIGEVAQIANWENKGGAPKTPD